MTQPVKPVTAPTDNAFAEININKLEEEWVKQPLNVAKYDKRLADAKNKLALAKATLDVTYAEVSEGIRRDPLKYNIEGKVTETRMKELVILRPEHKAALAKVNTIKHEVDILQAAMNALEHRKEALRNLVILWQHSYFSEMKVPTSIDNGMANRVRVAQKRAIRNPG